MRALYTLLIYPFIGACIGVFLGLSVKHFTRKAEAQRHNYIVAVQTQTEEQSKWGSSNTRMILINAVKFDLNSWNFCLTNNAASWGTNAVILLNAIRLDD
jgi:hypothetical protein